MIQNFWQHVTIYCMNHEEPLPMSVMEGATPFYACPHYFIADKAHPDGHKDDEKMCVNRISFTAMANVVDKFMKTVEADDADGIIMDYTGTTFNYNGIEVKILKYNATDTRIGILNRRALQ